MESIRRSKIMVHAPRRSGLYMTAPRCRWDVFTHQPYHGFYHALDQSATSHTVVALYLGRRVTLVEYGRRGVIVFFSFFYKHQSPYYHLPGVPRLTRPRSRADATIAAQATGAMSWAFITALKKNPQQSYVQLLNSIRDELATRYTQKPQLSCSHPLSESGPRRRTRSSPAIKPLTRRQTRISCLSCRYKEGKCNWCVRYKDTTAAATTMTT